jgi:hypothetical protein
MVHLWPNTQQELTRFYGKYLLRTAYRSKEVYGNIGLGEVWNVMNLLRGLAGDAPLAGPTFGDWSMRAAFNMLGGQGNPDLATTTGQFALGNLVRLLKVAYPNDSPAPTTLRGWISG